MRGAKRCPALPALFLLLLAAAPAPPGVRAGGGRRELEAPAGDRRTLLYLLFQTLGDSRSHPPHRPPPRGDRVMVRRYSGSYSGAADHEPRGASASASSSSSAPRERASGQGPRLPPSSRNVEIFPRDSNLKDKFIKHFTGPVSFSAECSKHFHRLYHNTRDCSTPAYYKRCARLLTRLAMSPLCTQP
ncbi:ALK and LTK ligand 1 [Carettochelys insculpta]|uniref:ALK and LTK ligand 1 n=1 Tax=Carettochelys insculpta TaxID=44489 RepID=UPI003EBF77B8